MTKVMLHDKLLHPSDYLAAVEFLGRDVTLTMIAIAHEDLVMKGGVKDNKPVFRFSETKKKFVCNKTNADSIAIMYGHKAEEWIGKRITFYPTQTAVGREMQLCIRVRETVPGQKLAASTSDDGQPSSTTASAPTPPAAETKPLSVARNHFDELTQSIAMKADIQLAFAEQLAHTWLKNLHYNRTDLADAGLWQIIWNKAQRVEWANYTPAAATKESEPAEASEA